MYRNTTVACLLCPLSTSSRPPHPLRCEHCSTVWRFRSIRLRWPSGEVEYFAHQYTNPVVHHPDCLGCWVEERFAA